MRKGIQVGRTWRWTFSKTTVTESGTNGIFSLFPFTLLINRRVASLEALSGIWRCVRSFLRSSDACICDRIPLRVSIGIGRGRTRIASSVGVRSQSPAKNIIAAPLVLVIFAFISAASTRWTSRTFQMLDMAVCR